MFLLRCLLTLLIPLGCFATSILRLSFEQTVGQAESIIEGDVVRNWCEWDSGHRFIWTHTEVAVRSRWKGSAGSTVTVSEPGGVVNGMALDVPGMVRYAPGEHVVVFLYRTPIGFLRTVGLSQGKLIIDRTNRVHPLRTDALVDPAGSRPSGTSIAEVDSLALTTVHDQVTRIAAATREVRK